MPKYQIDIKLNRQEYAELRKMLGKKLLVERKFCGPCKAHHERSEFHYQDDKDSADNMSSQCKSQRNNRARARDRERTRILSS